MLKPSMKRGQQQQGRDRVAAVQGKSEASRVVWELIQGNKRFTEERKNNRVKPLTFPMLVDHFIEDLLNPTRVKVVIMLDSRSMTSGPQLLGMHPSETRSVQICGNSCGKNDGSVGAVEFLVEKVLPPVVVVIGNSRNSLIECAMRVALKKHRPDEELPPSNSKLADEKLAGVRLVQLLVPIAEAALEESPRARFEKLCEIASHLNIWDTIENLMFSSLAISDAVKKGSLQVHGAFVDDDTGAMTFLGEHPSIERLVNAPPKFTAIRTAEDPPVPAAESLAQLYSGNRRYSAGKGGQAGSSDASVLNALSKSGQNPIAVVFGCADSRAPLEILFDMRPGDLFVLRNAGNSCNEVACSLIGSAEYAISALGSKLLVVTGHTQCGAVTAAVSLARQQESADSETGIGKVLETIMVPAVQAVAELPDAAEADQIKLATRLNVYETMKKLIGCSDVVRQGVLSGHLQVHGAIYDLFSGEVEWLGQNQDLQEICKQPLPLHEWNVAPYVRCQPQPLCASVLKLKEGNKRFVHGTTVANLSAGIADPFGIVYCSSETKIPLLSLFDVDPGELIVQRTLGGLNESADGDMLTGSLEFAIQHFSPKILVVLADSDSQLVDLALEQVRGTDAPSHTMMSILSDIMVSALKAKQQVSRETMKTSAAARSRMKQLTVELNAFYAIEQMLASPVIRHAAMYQGLQLHVALLDELTGEVDFIGEHPKLYDLLRRG